jgi:hypothetical protein
MQPSSQQTLGLFIVRPPSTLGDYGAGDLISTTALEFCLKSATINLMAPQASPALKSDEIVSV